MLPSVTCSTTRRSIVTSPGEVARAEGRTHQRRVPSRQAEDRLVGASQLGAHGGARLHEQVRMVPRVVADRVAIACDPAYRLRIGDGGAADEEEGRVDPLVLEHLEDAVGVRGIRTVVEGQRDLLQGWGAADERPPEDLVAGRFDELVAGIGAERRQQREREKSQRLQVRPPKRALIAATLARNASLPNVRKSSTRRS